jgi:peptide-methionine (S)-S-oxide reductase
MEQIVLGGGCFWCIEGGLQSLRGVSEVVPGYSGGHTENPTYEQVCAAKKADHAEVVRVTFDPKVIPRRTLLRVFHSLFDPTHLHRQGNDIGPQYRSIVLYSEGGQRDDALAVIEEISEYYDDPIVTEVVPLEVFWMAEPSHMDYFANNPQNPYCSAVVGPKIAKTRAKHADLYE